jgi:hypothetical protein
MEYNFLNAKGLNTEFFDDEGDLITKKLFVKLFHTVPNHEEGNCKLKIPKLFDFLCKEYGLEDQPGRYIRQDDYQVTKSKKGRLSKEHRYDITPKYHIIIERGLILEFSPGEYHILYDNNVPQNSISKLQDEITKFIKKKKNKRKHFYMVARMHSMFDLQEFDIKHSPINPQLHYNDDFEPFDETVRNFIKNKDQTGMVLMHGLPGTGKTSYIRYLINRFNKKFIFLPPYMAEALSSPDFLPFLSEHKNSILIIEDGEKLLKSRNNQIIDNGIANLLNISDGMLSDALGIKIICTFNTGLEKIDNALLRKGRMISRYEFKELSPEKAKVLAEKDNLNYRDSKPITLGNLYHSDTPETVGNINQKRIGF